MTHWTTNYRGTQYALTDTGKLQPITEQETQVNITPNTATGVQARYVNPYVNEFGETVEGQWDRWGFPVAAWDKEGYALVPAMSGRLVRADRRYPEAGSVEFVGLYVPRD